MDKIIIKDLTVFANHGVYPEENTLGQQFLVSATLYTDTRKAGKTDALSDSVNYGEVSHLIDQFMKTHTFQLIETVAEQLAQKILETYALIREVEIEVKKPWAPVGLPLDTVSVSIRRGWHTAFIALGSNMGDKEKYLADAVKGLEQTEGCRVKSVSDFIETAPYGGVEQDDFLNGVLMMETLLTPEEVLCRLHELENEANRERIVRWGPRTLDLDILLYDNLILDTPRLHIPHIDMHRRDFVLKPLCQIAPYVRHPVLSKTALELLEMLDL